VWSPSSVMFLRYRSDETAAKPNQRPSSESVKRVTDQVGSPATRVVRVGSSSRRQRAFSGVSWFWIRTVKPWSRRRRSRVSRESGATK
jgi:hypothetical protein